MLGLDFTFSFILCAKGVWLGERYKTSRECWRLCDVLYSASSDCRLPPTPIHLSVGCIATLLRWRWLHDPNTIAIILTTVAKACGWHSCSVARGNRATSMHWVYGNVFLKICHKKSRGTLKITDTPCTLKWAYQLKKILPKLKERPLGSCNCARWYCLLKQWIRYVELHNDN